MHEDRMGNRPIGRILCAGCPAWRSFVWALHCCDARAANPHARTGRPVRPQGRARAYSALLRVGFDVPPASPPARWALTPPFHPCRPVSQRAATPAWAVCFLCHCPSRDAVEDAARLVVDQHPALRSPDLPPGRPAEPDEPDEPGGPAIAWPASRFIVRRHPSARSGKPNGPALGWMRPPVTRSPGRPGFSELLSGRSPWKSR